MDSTDIEAPNVDLSLKEKTLERRDKGKSIEEKSPSSSKIKYPIEPVPRGLMKEIIKTKGKNSLLRKRI